MNKKILVEKDIEARMRDGVTVRADVYRLEDAGPLPVLLQRTPYGKGFSQNSFALAAAERGYTVVIQDTRGRWNSEGEDYPFLFEMSDGFDTVEWVARQPWSNGVVGMFGGSYVGYTQLAAAVTRPPALKTIAPTFTFCDPYAVAHFGGAMNLGAGISWGLMSGAFMAIQRASGSQEQKNLWLGQLIALADGMAQGSTFRQLPLGDIPLIGRNGLTPFFKDGLDHPTRDGYWQRITCQHADIQIPALHIGGWYDIFTANTLTDFFALQEKGSPEAKGNQKLIMGPWTHGTYEALNGEVDFGLQASWMLFLPDEVQLRWFDYWLKGIQNGIMEEPPVQIFVMGLNQWRFAEKWPLPQTQYIPYYLHSNGAANTLNGDGSLSPEKPSVEPVDTFVYDPLNPTPTRGGSLCCWQAALPSGAYDQRAVESRPDVLVFSSAPLEHDLEVTGPLTVHLWAASSVVDTDFTAKLVDVGPCGFARNLQDGIIRARYRDPGAVSLIKPGEVYEFCIDLAATSNVFKAGHCIRLEIASSNFPRFDRNPNTGRLSADDKELRPAIQTVFHDAQHPSYILLPVIPGSLL